MTDKDEPMPDDASVDESVLAYCAGQDATDIGNGRRFRRRFGDLASSDGNFRAIRVAHIGWHVFDGYRWDEDQEDALVRPLAHDVAEKIGLEAKLIHPSPEEEMLIEGGKECADILENDDSLSDQKKKELRHAVEIGLETAKGVSARRAARRKYGRSSQNSGKISSMLTEAAPYVARKVDDLNFDRLAVNCRSGTIRFLPPHSQNNQMDWWIADLQKHNASDMITKCAEAKWKPWTLGQHRINGAEITDPDGAAPPLKVFETFMEKVLPDEAIRAFLQRYFGYCLLGLTTEQVLLFFFGAGRNGKSTFMDTITRVLGDYAVTLAIESLAGDRQRGGAEATPDLARLPGARLVAASEPESGTKLKEALIKTMTGGEKFPVRRLHRDFFEIDPQFKMVISGNHKPVVTDDSDGTWRRLLLVPWDVQIAKEHVDVTLPERLRAESDAIFAWLVQGALMYLDDRGLGVPDAVLNASRDYRTESDPIDGFLQEACTVTGQAHDYETSRALFEGYQRWCKETGAFEYTNNLFHRRLAGKTKRVFSAPDGTMQQFSKAKTNGTSVYRGIRVDTQFGPKVGGQYGEEA